MSDQGTPDSAVCAAARDYACRACEPFLFNHVVRSFLFADAVGRESGARYDVELLYVACLLHDLGLGRAAPVRTRFEVEGAETARLSAAEFSDFIAAETGKWTRVVKDARIKAE